MAAPTTKPCCTTLCTLPDRDPLLCVVCCVFFVVLRCVLCVVVCCALCVMRCALCVVRCALVVVGVSYVVWCYPCCSPACVPSSCRREYVFSRLRARSELFDGIQSLKRQAERLVDVALQALTSSSTRKVNTCACVPNAQ